MAIFKFVCDRCKKETTSFLKIQTERVGSYLCSNCIRIKGSYWLCDKCAEDFTDRFMIPTKDTKDEAIEKCDNTSTENLPLVYWDLGDGKLLKVPDSLVDISICIAAEEKAKGGDNNA